LTDLSIYAYNLVSGGRVPEAALGMADEVPGMAAGGSASIDEAVEWLRKHFDSEAARGLTVSFQYVLTGPAGGSFHARVDDGRLEAEVGEIPSPDASFRLQGSDFFAILAGRENADLLFTAGRIDVEGDLSIALKMRSLFRPKR
jgi:predicted lipid carrier protein YhbT